MGDFDDYNGFDEDDFMDDDSFEDGFGENFEMDDPLDDGDGIEAEPTGDDLCDDEFTTKDAVMLGSAMGWAYEEALEERKRRKLEKKMDADRDNLDRENNI